MGLTLYRMIYYLRQILYKPHYFITLTFPEDVLCYLVEHFWVINLFKILWKCKTLYICISNSGGSVISCSWNAFFFFRGNIIFFKKSFVFLGYKNPTKSFCWHSGMEYYQYLRIFYQAHLRMKISSRVIKRNKIWMFSSKFCQRCRHVYYTRTREQTLIGMAWRLSRVGSIAPSQGGGVGACSAPCLTGGDNTHKHTLTCTLSTRWRFPEMDAPCRYACINETHELPVDDVI